MCDYGRCDASECVSLDISIGIIAIVVVYYTSKKHLLPQVVRSITSLFRPHPFEFRGHLFLAMITVVVCRDPVETPHKVIRIEHPRLRRRTRKASRKHHSHSKAARKRARARPCSSRWIYTCPSGVTRPPAPSASTSSTGGRPRAAPSTIWRLMACTGNITRGFGTSTTVPDGMVRGGALATRRGACIKCMSCLRTVPPPSPSA